MPGMTGLELVETLRKEQGAKRPYFAIMSGYNDFEYARQAICNACLDYILKPVSRADLLALLQRVQKLYREEEEKKAEETRNEKAFFTRRLTSVLYGKRDPQTLDYVRERLHLHGGHMLFHGGVHTARLQGLHGLAAAHHGHFCIGQFCNDVAAVGTTVKCHNKRSFLVRARPGAISGALSAATLCRF